MRGMILSLCIRCKQRQRCYQNETYGFHHFALFSVVHYSVDPLSSEGSIWKLTNAKCVPSGAQLGTLSLPAPPTTFTSSRILPSLGLRIRNAISLLVGWPVTPLP